jgi:hypothetical protein
MAYRNIVSDQGFGALEGTMNNCSILYVYLVAYADGINIATHHCIKPDAAIISNYYITHDRAIRSYKTITTPFWKNIFHR